MKQYGTWKIPCKYKDRSTVVEFYIVDKDGPAILGLLTSRELRLITVHCEVTTNPGVTPAGSQKPIASKEDLIVMYPDRFQGISRFPGEYHIVIDPTQVPVVHAAWKCPIKLRDDIKMESSKRSTSPLIG